MSDQRHSRRSFLRGLGSLTATALAGCSTGGDSSTTENTGTSNPTATRTTATGTPTATEVPDKDGDGVKKGEDPNDSREDPEIFFDTMDALKPETAEMFEEAITDEQGKYTERGSELVEDKLVDIEELGTEHRNQTARDIANEGELTDTLWRRIDSWLESPEEFQKEAFKTGIRDSDNDGMGDGLEEYLSHGQDDEDIARLVDDLLEEGLSELDLEYLETVGMYADYYKDVKYGRWKQAQEFGLLEEATSKGYITEEDLEKVKDNDGDRLINAKEREIGTDPDKRDSRGDGYLDSYKWVMKEVMDFPAPVNLDKIDLYVEVVTEEGVEPLSDELKEKVSEPFEKEGDIELHFFNTGNNAEIEETDGYKIPQDEHFDYLDAGVHGLLVLNGLTKNGRAMGGLHWYDSPANFVQEKDDTVLHELLQSMGLYHRDYEGIDSDKVSFDTYSSVLNYNAPEDTYKLNRGAPFDDMEHLRESNFDDGDRRFGMLREVFENGV